MNTLQTLLQSQPDEPALQNFFEQDPERLCGSIYLMGSSVIRKLPIGNDYVSDFVYVNPQSGRTKLHLVEIESSTKRIFNQDHSFTAEFNHAMQQVRDWIRYCSENNQQIRDILEPLRRVNGDQVGFYAPIGTLLYGRREEINCTLREERWRSLQPQNHELQVRTYDGHAESLNASLDSSLSSARCVKYNGREFVQA
ncbi:hypothetical protein GGR77_003688 [Xanthomonas translucens]